MKYEAGSITKAGSVGLNHDNRMCEQGNVTKFKQEVWNRKCKAGSLGKKWDDRKSEVGIAGKEVEAGSITKAESVGWKCDNSMCEAENVEQEM